MRFNIKLDLSISTDPEGDQPEGGGEPDRDSDLTGGIVEHGDDLPTTGWRIGFQPNTPEDNS